MKKSIKLKENKINELNKKFALISNNAQKITGSDFEESEKI
jgi:hypothetical protein